MLRPYLFVATETNIMRVLWLESETNGGLTSEGRRDLNKIMPEAINKPHKLVDIAHAVNDNSKVAEAIAESLF